MTRPYKLNITGALPHNHPLHWTQFWPDLQRLHRGKIEARQDLILWLANLYRGAIKSGKPRGFCEVQVRLMDLRDQVRDYRPALDYFFTIKQLGFNLGEENMELSTLVPRTLSRTDLELVNAVTTELHYEPGVRPENAAISKVYLQPNLNQSVIINRLLSTGRPEIIPQLIWLLRQPPEINFYFARSGKLQLRDTSVWPIAAVETWPGWLREMLFGQGIDLDSAYVQFLMEHLEVAFHDRSNALRLMFPDLLRLLEDKESFREELCLQILQHPYTDQYRGTIKQVLMSLANGSKISPTLLTNGSGFSLTADIILKAAPHATTSELMLIGARLQRIAAQFSAARKYACLGLLKRAPNRQNIKSVFSGYFAWERRARYALWEAVDQHGIMVHDGLDGVPQQYLDRLPEIMKKLNLRLTA